MNFLLHKECGETAVEGPGTVLPQLPEEFPFICLSCLGEVEGPSDLVVSQMTGQ